ncbi:hypothetical protein [Nocardiopsis sp. TNDT3]|uniref:hypothetical protein n=1 Tax=Nocardiopsis sp. TNDT3 TaxID=2249354 RepID=UPI000E3E04A5|nr:hypothetical protein [Nocardiopsis sp. TNDT3]
MSRFFPDRERPDPSSAKPPGFDHIAREVARKAEAHEALLGSLAETKKQNSLLEEQNRLLRTQNADLAKSGKHVWWQWGVTLFIAVLGVAAAAWQIYLAIQAT